MASADIRRLVDEHLQDPASGWSMGTLGAIAVAVALRQLVHTHGASTTLTTLRSRHHTPDDLLDPEGDPDAG